MATTRIVLGGCRSSDDGPLSIRDRSRLTQRIVGFYRTAAERLPSDMMPAVLHGGFCIGILDPVSNIVANAVTGGSVGTNNGDAEETEPSLEAMARRSLDGLVAFLVSYFRYFPPDEALRYLRAARADLRAAVRLVESDRYTQAFRLDSGTARTALRCAALAARHPDPDHWVTATLTIFSRRREVYEVLFPQPGCCISAVAFIIMKKKKKQGEGRLSATAVERIRRILDAAPVLPDTDRPHSVLLPVPDRPSFIGARSSRLRLAAFTYSLSRLLLNRIHCFYLEALALLPPERLRSHYHRSLVIAGHCYGPLDPVSNIILNTVWLDATFPASKEQQFQLPMISSSALLRLAHRSLEGMVAFLRVFFGGDLSDLDAYRFLFYADANLGVAMEALKQARADQCDEANGHPTFAFASSFINASRRKLCFFSGKRIEPKGDHPTGVSLSNLYQAAVTAAMHPRPDMLREFLASGQVRAMLPHYSGRSLSCKDVRSLSISLSESTKPCSQDDGLPLLPAKYQRLPQMAREGFILNQEQFQRELALFSRMVEAALKEYTKHNGGTEYELVFICGGNASVDVDYPRSIFKYHYCHVNFLARPRGSDAAQTLFFAEWVKYDKSSDLGRKTICCPVVVVPPKHAAEELRCYYCEYEGASIVHPTERNYHGCDTDLEKMVLGKNLFRTDKVVYNAKGLTDFMGLLPEDYVYFDPVHSHIEHVQTENASCE